MTIVLMENKFLSHSSLFHSSVVTRLCSATFECGHRLFEGVYTSFGYLQVATFRASDGSAISLREKIGAI